MLPGAKQGVWKELRTGGKAPKEIVKQKNVALYCSCGGRRCDRWGSYTSGGDGSGLLEAAVRDAAFETAIEGGLEINEMC